MRRLSAVLSRALVFLVATTLSCAPHTTRPADPAAPVPAPTSSLLTAVDRSPEDRALDRGRRPAELLAFAGVRAGMRVAEIGAWKGYTSELLARAVAPDGLVYAQDSPEFEHETHDAWSARAQRPTFARIVRVARPYRDPLPPDIAPLDAVFSVLFYHDLVWLGVDRAMMNRAVFQALKPGGVYVVADHSARAGAGLTVTKSLHRVEESAVVDEITRAGFVLDGRADFLLHPEDPRDWSASEEAPPEKRGTSDRFVLRFRKPAPFSWSGARRDAKAARDAHDDHALRRALADLYAHSGSPWLALELARVDVALGDRATALGDLEAFAKMGMSSDVASDPKLAPLQGDPALGPIAAKLQANARPVKHAEELLPLPHDELITEDITLDDATRTFLVSSVRHRKILSVASDGSTRDLLPETASSSSILGLALAGRRIWATTAPTPPMLRRSGDAAAAKSTALLAIDPTHGDVLERIELPSTGSDASLSDLTIGRDGTVFVSDSSGGSVYALRPGEHTLSRIVIADELVSPQTPALSADGRTLFVPDYVRGIAAIDLATSRVEWLGRADDVALTGIDGLYLDGASFLAVQNGMKPPRIARLVLGPDARRVVRAEVLERATPGFGEPTHGLIRDGFFYFLANAGWDRFDDDGHRLANPPADAPAIWRLRL